MKKWREERKRCVSCQSVVVPLDTVAKTVVQESVPCQCGAWSCWCDCAEMLVLKKDLLENFFTVARVCCKVRIDPFVDGRCILGKVLRTFVAKEECAEEVGLANRVQIPH